MSALFAELALISERSIPKPKDIVTFKGKKGVWRTTHGTHIFIPSDGSTAVMPKRGPDIKLKRKKPPPPPQEAPKAEPKSPSAGDLWTAFKGMSGAEKADTLKKTLGALSDGALGFLTRAKEATQRFFMDPEHRAKSLNEAAAALKKSPGRLAANVWTVLKEDGVEAKDSFVGLGRLRSKEGASAAEMKAVKSSAIKFGLVAAGIAMSGVATLASLPVAVSVVLAKGVVLKAVARTIAEHRGEHAAHKAGHIAHKAHEGFEAAEIAHHAAHLFTHAIAHGARHAVEGLEMAKEAVVEGVFDAAKQAASFYKKLLANIADEMSKVTPEDIAKIADEVAKEANKAAKSGKKSKKGAKSESVGALVLRARSLLEKA